MDHVLICPLYLSVKLYICCIFFSLCVYIYVHISLFLPECACTTIIDISPRIFSLMYCCCVSIILVICICPPGALIWLINLFLFLFLYFKFQVRIWTKYVKLCPFGRGVASLFCSASNHTLERGSFFLLDAKLCVLRCFHG